MSGSRAGNPGPLSPASGRSLSANLIFSGATHLTDFLLLGLMIAAARFLGPEDYGVFAFGLAFASVLTFLTNPGLDSLLVNRVARERDGVPRTVGLVLGWKLMLTAAVAALFVAALFLTIENPLARAVALVLTGAAVVRSFNVTLRSVLHAHERFDLETAIVATDRTLLLGAGLAVLLVSRDPLHLAGVFLATRIVTLTWACWLVRGRVCRFRIEHDLSFAWRFQREALPFGIAALLFGVSTQVDTLLLGMLAASDAVGRFGASMKLYEGLLAGALIVNLVIYPRMSQQFVTEPEEALRLFETAMRYMLILGAFVAAAGTLYGEAAVALLFGEGYAGAGALLAVLMWGVAVRFQISTLFTVFRARRIQTPIMWLSVAGLGVRILINLLLIPLYGPMAAATAVLVSESLILLGAWLVGRKLGVPFARPLKALPAVALAAGGAAAVTGSLMGGMALALQIAVLGLIYVGVLLATQAIRFEEIKGLKQTSEGIGG